MARGGAGGGDPVGVAGRTVAEDSANAYNRPIMELHPRYAQHAGNVTVQRLAAALEKRGDVRLADIRSARWRAAPRWPCRSTTGFMEVCSPMD